MSFGWRNYDGYEDTPGDIMPLPYKRMTTRTLWQPETYYYDEPYGEIVQATVYIEMPVDELKDKKVSIFIIF